jgi:hypothetical protein
MPNAIPLHFSITAAVAFGVAFAIYWRDIRQSVTMMEITGKMTELEENDDACDRPVAPFEGPSAAAGR